MARLGVADLVSDDEPMAVEELAARAGADAPSLHRLLRLLASCGVFSEPSPGALVRAPLSHGLRSDAAARRAISRCSSAPTAIGLRARCSAR